MAHDPSFFHQWHLAGQTRPPVDITQTTIDGSCPWIVKGLQEAIYGESACAYDLFLAENPVWRLALS